MKPVILSVYALVLIAFGVALVPVCERLDRIFSSPSSVVAGDESSVTIISTLFDDPNDIPYWPSIDELQWFAETKRDGLFRKNSQDDYEARRWVWYCNQSARLVWAEQR